MSLEQALQTTVGMASGTSDSTFFATTSDTSGVFSSATHRTLKLVERYVAEKRINMLFASLHINREGAKLGYLLSSLITGEGSRENYRSFFANSGLEGIAGAMKLARHTSLKAERDDAGAILMLDAKSTYRPFLDAMRWREESGLCPSIEYVRSADEAEPLLEKRRWAGVAIVLDEGTPEELNGAKKLIQRARQQGAMALLCNLHLPLSHPVFHAPALDADVHVFGENLTERQVPFGCFTMSPRAYSTWNNPQDSLGHSSTFGGNGICLAIALETMEHHGCVSARAKQVFADIDASMERRIEHFSLYVNRPATEVLASMGMAIDVVHASGGRLKLADGREVIDCGACGGASLRGHNPSDVVQEVLHVHDPASDYFDALQKQLRELTPYDTLVPAVSGASAVDNAITLAMLANSNPKRRKIVTFTGNYSGKTLVSLNLSRHGVLAADPKGKLYRPYYPDMVYVDPTASDAAATLERILLGGDVAVMWFEMIQGYNCWPIPQALIDVVNRCKQQGGYIVGVDEVLTGYWRRTTKFLAHMGVVDADFTTLGKAMSDMLIPIGGVLLKKEIYARAQATDAEHVRRLAHWYRNNFSAHVAAHALTKVRAENRLAASTQVLGALRTTLDRIANSSRLFSMSRGERGHVRLMLNSRYFPFERKSLMGQLLESGLSSLLLEACHVNLSQLRFFMAALPDPQDVTEACRRLELTTRNLTPFMLYRYVFAQFALAAIAPRWAGRINQKIVDRARKELGQEILVHRTA